VNKKIKLLKEAGFGYLVELAKEIQLQYKENRNLATDKPVYCVYRKERYAAPEDRSVPCIVNSESELRYGFGEEWYESKDEIKEILKEENDSGDGTYDVESELDNEEIRGNIETIETQIYAFFEMCFMTQKAANEWIRINKHHGDYFVYVHSLSLWSKGKNDLEKVYDLLFNLDLGE